MKILQFGGGDRCPFLPHNYVTNCVVYAGDDNDAALGWYRRVPE
jgi:4-alpha-glucanotransferase